MTKIRCVNCNSGKIDITYSKFPYIVNCLCRNCKKEFKLNQEQRNVLFKSVLKNLEI